MKLLYPMTNLIIYGAICHSKDNMNDADIKFPLKSVYVQKMAKDASQNLRSVLFRPFYLTFFVIF